MRHQSLPRRVMLACTILLLLVLAWAVLVGGVRQLGRSHTMGQQVETVVQLMCGGLTLLVVVTTFYARRWPTPFALPGVSLAATAGLSALVWGPPVPLTALLFTGLALLVAWVVIRALRTAGAKSAVNRKPGLLSSSGFVVVGGTCAVVVDASLQRLSRQR